jgi:rod shape-determining protein MreC
MIVIQKYHRIAIFVFLFVAIIILLSRKIPQDRDLNFLEGLVLDAAYPLQRAIISFSNSVRSIFQGYIYLFNAHRENTVLRNRLKEMEKKLSHLMEVELENQRLRQLLDFKSRLAMNTVPASVIGEDSSGWFRIILIDKGKSSGIRTRMAVIVEDGIVGHVLESSAHTSKVLLITDRNSAIDTRIQRTRSRGILEGNSNGGCVLKYLHQADRLKPGDLVISSGLGGVYPGGLPVGTVSSVRKSENGLFQVAEVTPYVDFSKLQEVLVILDHPSKGALDSNSSRN